MMVKTRQNSPLNPIYNDSFQSQPSPMGLNWFVLWVLVQGFMVFCSEHCLKILPKRPATKNTNQPRLLTSHLVSDVAGFGKGPMAWEICFTSLKQVSVGDDSYPQFFWTQKPTPGRYAGLRDQETQDCNSWTWAKIGPWKYHCWRLSIGGESPATVLYGTYIHLTQNDICILYTI